MTASGKEVLNAVQIEDALTNLEGWEQKGMRLVRTFVFPKYMDAIDFVVEIAGLAEKSNHHPDIHINHKKVRFELWTHSVNGVTPLDVEMAGKINKAGEAAGVG